MIKQIARTVPFLQEWIGKDFNKFSERTFALYFYDLALNGKLYDWFHYDFHERIDVAQVYIPICERRPCVRVNLCKLIVDDSVSLLFSDSRFPTIECKNDNVRTNIERIIKHYNFTDLFIDAATKGAIGSVAIHFGLLPSRELFFDVLKTIFLTPEFDTKTKELTKVTELYEVSGRDLERSGYQIAAKDLQCNFLFKRVWDKTQEIYFYPKISSSRDLKPSLGVGYYDSYFAPEEYQEDEEKDNWIIDKRRTVTHKLGFVPIMWIKNLQGGDNYDGLCTFRDAIENSVELDYQLSQGGRGLKYSGEPQLIISTDQDISEISGGNKSKGEAIVLKAGAKAELLEIKGDAIKAVMDYAKLLREMTLEVVHGNRSDMHKMSVAQSGKAMEMMNQSLVWLADRLRVTYGEGGLLPMFKKILFLIKEHGVKLGGKELPRDFDIHEEIALRWGKWFPLTPDDQNKQSMALAQLKGSGLISTETAINSLASEYEILNTSEEISSIEADQKKLDNRMVEKDNQITNKLSEKPNNDRLNRK